MRISTPGWAARKEPSRGMSQQTATEGIAATTRGRVWLYPRAARQAAGGLARVGQAAGVGNQPEPGQAVPPRRRPEAPRRDHGLLVDPR